MRETRAGAGDWHGYPMRAVSAWELILVPQGSAEPGSHCRTLWKFGIWKSTHFQVQGFIVIMNKMAMSLNVFRKSMAKLEHVVEVRS